MYPRTSNLSVVNNDGSKTSVKWLDVPIGKFNSAVPQLVDKLKNINSNIAKLKRLDQWEEVRKQETIAWTTANQLSSMVKEMDSLRNQVLESEVLKFDKSIKYSKQSALTAVKNVRPSEGINHTFSTPNEDEDIERAMLQDQQLQAIAEVTEQIKVQEYLATEMDRVQADIEDVKIIFHELSQLVHEQGEKVEIIENNVETTQVNVSQGEKMLCQALKYKNGMYPLMGALAGSLVGGPIGLMAGFKLGSLTAAGCGVLGFTGGKFLKSQNESHIKEAEEHRTASPL